MKPRSDSKLKTLPAQKQEQLYALLRANSYKAALPLVQKTFGVVTSEASLSQFYSWYPLSRRLEQAKSFADQLKESLAKNPALNLDAEKLSTVAQVAFEAQAVQEQDSALFMGLRKLRQKDADLALQAKNQDLRLRQYEEKISAARASLEKAASKGGLSKETRELIEQQLALL